MTRQERFAFEWEFGNMPQGLQVWDESGVLVLDTSTITGKSLVDLGEVTGSGSTSISVPSGTTAVVSTVGGSQDYVPQVSLSGGTISWAPPSGSSSSRGRIYVDLL